tara:strand:+ start:212 stop:637 length:426 start_codon:yes stop_codon:yes gene_type:complete
MINCPCKLFKYYDTNGVYYYCADRESNIDYTIKEFQHKDRLDVFLNNIKNIASSSNLDTTEVDYLAEYLNNHNSGTIINILDRKAIFVDEIKRKKLFFSADDLSVSYEIVLSGNNAEAVSLNFTKCINSLLLKKNNLKTIF